MTPKLHSRAKVVELLRSAADLVETGHRVEGRVEFAPSMNEDFVVDAFLRHGGDRAQVISVEPVRVCPQCGGDDMRFETRPKQIKFAMVDAAYSITVAICKNPSCELEWTDGDSGEIQSQAIIRALIDFNRETLEKVKTALKELDDALEKEDR